MPVDETKPVIIAIDDITIELSPFRYTNNIRVWWSEPTVTDNSGRVKLISTTKSPDNTYPVGTTTIEYIYSDYSGNEEFVSFNVTVLGSGLFIVTLRFTYYNILQNQNI